VTPAGAWSIFYIDAGFSATSSHVWLNEAATGSNKLLSNCPVKGGAVANRTLSVAGPVG